MTRFAFITQYNKPHKLGYVIVAANTFQIPNMWSSGRNAVECGIFSATNIVLVSPG